MVALATTNHPERLDPAILDRPGRFDRKYYFDLPAPAERLAYVSAWDGGLRPEMRISGAARAEVVARTEEFSFAYLKELFLSAMMQWMSAAGAGGMDAVILERAARLREQMSSPAEAQRKDDGEDVE